jgi:hypothetical protein
LLSACAERGTRVCDEICRSVIGIMDDMEIKITSPETFPLLPEDKPEILHQQLDIRIKRSRSSASGPLRYVDPEEASKGRWSAWIKDTRDEPFYESVYEPSGHARDGSVTFRTRPRVALTNWTTARGSKPIHPSSDRPSSIIKAGWSLTSGDIASHVGRRVGEECSSKRDGVPGGGEGKDDGDILVNSFELGRGRDVP